MPAMGGATQHDIPDRRGGRVGAELGHHAEGEPGQPHIVDQPVELLQLAELEQHEGKGNQRQQPRQPDDEAMQPARWLGRRRRGGGRFGRRILFREDSVHRLSRSRWRVGRCGAVEDVTGGMLAMLPGHRHRSAEPGGGLVGCGLGAWGEPGDDDLCDDG